MSQSAKRARRLPPSNLDVFQLDVAGVALALLTYDAPLTLPHLTDAERSVLNDLLEGKTNAQIAALRMTSPRTVANQVASLFRKLSVRSRGELAARYGAWDF
jgi:DNA-binding NarL/FixJ family response regulator